jgi:hypothetical protein
MLQEFDLRGVSPTTSSTIRAIGSFLAIDLTVSSSEHMYLMSYIMRLNIYAPSVRVDGGHGINVSGRKVARVLRLVIIKSNSILATDSNSSLRNLEWNRAYESTGSAMHKSSFSSSFDNESSNRLPAEMDLYKLSLGKESG